MIVSMVKIWPLGSTNFCDLPANQLWSVVRREWFRAIVVAKFPTLGGSYQELVGKCWESGGRKHVFDGFFVWNMVEDNVKRGEQMVANMVYKQSASWLVVGFLVLS